MVFYPCLFGFVRLSSHSLCTTIMIVSYPCLFSLGLTNIETFSALKSCLSLSINDDSIIAPLSIFLMD